MGWCSNQLSHLARANFFFLRNNFASVLHRTVMERITDAAEQRAWGFVPHSQLCMAFLSPLLLECVLWTLSLRAGGVHLILFGHKHFSLCCQIPGLVKSHSQLWTEKWIGLKEKNSEFLGIGFPGRCLEVGIHGGLYLTQQFRQEWR